MTIPTSLGSEVRLAFRYKGYNADAWWIYELCALDTNGTGYPEPTDCGRFFEDFETITYPGLPCGWVVRDGSGDQSSVDWQTGESEYFYPTVFHNWDRYHNVVQFLLTPPFSIHPNGCSSDADCEPFVAECVGGKSRVYAGQCSSGTCSYSHADTDCATLAVPTSDACDGDDITTYAGPATCAAGVCEFAKTTTHCANGCTVDGDGTGSCLGAATGCGAALAAMYAATGAPGGDVWSWSSGNEGWGLDSQSSPSGKWNRKTIGRTDGNSIGFSTCGGYSDNADWRTKLTSSYNLSACVACNVNVGFWAYGETEAGYDKLYAQCSGDGGSQWLTAGETSGPKTTWTEQTWTLPAGCMTSNFRMSFDFKSDGWVTAQGYDVDDVRISPNSGPGAGEVETLSFDQATGWACHSGNDNEALKVHVYFTRHSGGAPWERVVTADVSREQAVADACNGAAGHGWVLMYDPELMRWLGSEPYTVRAFSTPPSACGGDAWELPKKGNTKVLFVANGNYTQDADIEKHLEDLGNYSVTVMKDSELCSYTDLSSYDLFILTGFAGGLSSGSLSAIENTGKPVLIISYRGHRYAQEFGLVVPALDCDSYPSQCKTDCVDTLYVGGSGHPITSGLPSPLVAYNLPEIMYDVGVGNLTSGVTPLIYSDSGHNRAVVWVDDARHIVVTGGYDTGHYTADGWELFDRLLGYFSPVSVQGTWVGSPTMNDSIFINAVSAPGGGLLASTSFGDVYRVSDTGATSLLFDGNSDVPRPRALLNPAGNTFIVRDAESISLYDADGTLLGTSAVEGAHFSRPVTNTELIFVPQWNADIGEGESENPVIGGSIIDADGNVQSSFSAEGLRGLNITSARMIYLTRDDIVVLNLQGDELWRVPQRAESFDASEQATKLIVEDGQDTTRVLHFHGALQAHAVSLGGAVWNVAMSPDGVYSAATTEQAVHIFHDGELRVSKSLPVTYAVSVDVSNLGEVVVGGQNADATPHLFLLDRNGKILWEDQGTNVDRYGWRPEVRFQTGGEAITARTKSGIGFYQIERGW
ncbi:MAG: hypothetical protein PHU25_09550 [Deltaproteobacteria bacterium]|nr:hypothetical protein [Deltaproteobacteria bacterium]